MRIGVTLGDPAGVGPEIVAKALESDQVVGRWECVVIGEAPSDVVPGQPSTQSAQAAYEALQQGVALLRGREIDAIATGPVHKAGLQALGFAYPGLTEFFAHEFAAAEYAMILSGPTLTVALATTHVPISEVAANLSVGGICQAGEMLGRFLCDLGITGPRVGVAALNPHAGEEGRFGLEEQTVIQPAIEALRQKWGNAVDFSDPLPADSLFYQAYRGDYHGVLCCYHDQGLIPLKMVDFDSAVNVTYGLPIVRTSPDHGTAFDIAGKDVANPQSMINAICLAGKLAQRRAKKL